MTVQMALRAMQTNTGLKCDPQKIFNHPSTFNLKPACTCQILVVLFRFSHFVFTFYTDIHTAIPNSISYFIRGQHLCFVHYVLEISSFMFCKTCL